jgi:hypothetical protein
MSGTDVRILDITTGAKKTIEYAHKAVHNGDHFYIAESNALDAAGTRDLILTVAATTKWPHLIFAVDGVFVTRVDLFETTTHNVAAAVAAINNNRNSATAAGMTVNVSAGGGVDGTSIYTWTSGVSTGTGSSRVVQSGASRGDQEIVLKQNTKYLLRVTSSTAANLTNTLLSWYENIDKTAATM